MEGDDRDFIGCKEPNTSVSIHFCFDDELGVYFAINLSGCLVGEARDFYFDMVNYIKKLDAEQVEEVPFCEFQRVIKRLERGGFKLVIIVQPEVHCL